MPTCQGQHPDGSDCGNPAPEGQTRCYIHRRPDPSASLSREDVMAAIDEHDGPEGLDLSHENLAGIDLSRAEPERELELLSRAMTQYWPRLSGVNFQGASLLEAELQRADLAFADLRDADLYRADLQGANLQLARLQRVDLSAASDITRIRWYGAVLDKTRMRRDQLMEKIEDEEAAQQWEKDYKAARKKKEGNRIKEVARTHYLNSYDRAREAYLALKTNFNELGRYDDASWAYRKERRLERAMSWPGRAAREYKEEKERLEKEHPWLGKAWFYFTNTVTWLWDGAVELATDYGESPRLVLGWATLLLLVVYPIIYDIAAGGRPPWEAPLESVLAFVLDYPANLLVSLGAFSTLDVVNLSAADPWTRLWAASEAMLGISFLALLMFTLGNRISRS